MNKVRRLGCHKVVSTDMYGYTKRIDDKRKDDSNLASDNKHKHRAMY